MSRLRPNHETHVAWSGNPKKSHEKHLGIAMKIVTLGPDFWHRMRLHG
jgi:hypothetical protein